MSSLLPSSTLVETWATLADAAACANLDDGMLRAFNRQLGDHSNDSLQVIAVIPGEVCKAAIDSASRGGRSLTAIEKAS